MYANPEEAAICALKYMKDHPAADEAELRSHLQDFELASETLNIYITEKDSREGRCGEPQCCPVALATRRTLKRLKKKAGLNHRAIAVNAGRERVWCRTTHFPYSRCYSYPPSLRDAVLAFDIHEIPVKPGKYTLTWEKGAS